MAGMEKFYDDLIIINLYRHLLGPYLHMVYPIRNWFHRPYNARNFTTTFQDLKNIYYSWHVAPEVVVIAGKISFWAPWVESCVSPFIVTWNTYEMGSNSFWIRNIWIFIYTGSLVPADFSSVVFTHAHF